MNTNILSYPFLSCFLTYTVNILTLAAMLIVTRFLFNPPRELFRKMLHLVAFTSTAFIVAYAKNWQAAAWTMVLFAMLVWPVLKFFERFSWYSDLFIERRAGEIKNSLLLLFLSQAAFVTFCWGFLGDRWMAALATVAWGVGDAMAALIGKRFGKHHTNIPLADKKKTWEGTFAMFVSAFLVYVIGLSLLSNLSLGRILLRSIFGAAVNAYVELITKNGNDTITVPISGILVLWLFNLL